MAEVEPTAAQMKAIQALERALRQCKKARIYFHNCYGTLVAYDGTVVEKVNDSPNNNKLACGEGQSVKSPYHLDSWADDRHYIHLREQAKGR